MKEVVLITGANGMVAKRLSEILGDNFSIRYLTRKKKNENEFEWDIINNKIDKNSLIGVNHIIHLAGAGIADKKWTSKRKEIILSSRIDSSKLILNTLKEYNIKITSFISASAIGYYGTETTEHIYDENNKNGNDFLSAVCLKWEQIANQYTNFNITERTIIIRIGIILSKKGGVLNKIIKPIKYYLGAALGNGNQYMPWIHIDDLCNIFKYSINNESISGVYNAVSPEHITNEEFTRSVANSIKKPILSPNIPSFLIKFIFGESSILLLKGSRVSSKKIIESGFVFKYSNLNNALKNL